MFYLLVLFIILLTYLSFKFFYKVELRKAFNEYKIALKNIGSIKINNPVEVNEKLFNNLRNQAIKFLFKLLIVFIPYLIILYLISFFEPNFYLKYLIPCFPYFPLFFKK